MSWINTRSLKGKVLDVEGGVKEPVQFGSEW